MTERITKRSGGIQPFKAKDARVEFANSPKRKDSYLTTGEFEGISDEQLQHAGADKRADWARQRVHARLERHGIDATTIPPGMRDAIIRTVAGCTTFVFFKVVDWNNVPSAEEFVSLSPMVKGLKEERSIMRVNAFLDLLADGLKTTGGKPSGGSGKSSDSLGFSHELRVKLVERFPDLAHRMRSIVAMALPAMRPQVDYGVSATCLAGMFVGAGQAMSAPVLSTSWSAGVTTFLRCGI